MKIEDIVKKAKYIQFPYNNEEYRPHYVDRYPVLLPIITDHEVLYKGMPKDNGHHYTTDYTYKYVLPTIDKLLKFKFSLKDFNLVNVNNGVYDLSYLKPKTNDIYTITCFDTNKTVMGDYRVLMNPEFFKNPLYRELYRYPHRCSRIVNNTTKSRRKLMVSGDSQMIPSIVPLAHYFKEVWYFDNRTGYYRDEPGGKQIFHNDKFRSFADTYKGTTFTDVLISCYCRDLGWYEYWNLQ